MEIFGFTIAIFIGIVMGLIGGGGSILCVPVFAYLFGFDAVMATTLSLFVVGFTSAIGSLGYYKKGNLEVKTALWFGIPSIISVIVVRKIILPVLPNTLFTFGDIIVSKNVFLLLFFAILMLFSSYKMILGTPKYNKKTDKPHYQQLMINGFGVGIITGLIGAGGGFLIIPALVMLLNLDIKKAIGTSMLIISMNSLFGFASSVRLMPIDWSFLALFTSLSLIGLFIGMQISKKLDSQKLKPLFGWFVLAVGLFIIIKELFF